MVEVTGAPIAGYFAALDDPRIDRTKRHKLLDIVTIAICATICGADSWVDIELFGNCKEEWFKSFLELPNGIPSHDTFGDVFARLDPEQFQRCFIEWIQAVAQVTQGEVVAIDGKTVRLKGNGSTQSSIEDVNGDGLLDLAVKIVDVDGTYAQGSGIGTLTGQTFDGVVILGTDSICITQ